MPHLDTKVTYCLEFSAEESRIVGLALLGRLRKQEDILAARRINHRLQQSKARMAAVIKDAAERNVEGATVALAEAAKEYSDHERRPSRRSRRK
jgi:hypothetical protein